jgi:hypothetical protein
MRLISPGWKAFKRVRHWLAGLLVGVVALLFGLAVFGFPDFLTRLILTDANSGDYFIQVHEMRECRVLYHLVERPGAGRSRIKELNVSDGLLRPLWSSSHSGFKGARGSSDGKRPAGHQVNVFSQLDLDVAFFNFDVMGVWVEQGRAVVQIDAHGVALSRLYGKIGRELHSGTIEGALVWRQEGTVAGRLATSFVLP